MLKINELQEEFEENESEIETGARESIGETVERILEYFEIDIDSEEAMRERGCGPVSKKCPQNVSDILGAHHKIRAF
jgi:hypothetical protein